MEIKKDDRLHVVVGVRTARDVVDEGFSAADEVSDTINGFHRAIPADRQVSGLLREALRTGSWISYDIETLEDDGDPNLRLLTAVTLDFVSPPRRSVTFESARSPVWTMNRYKPRIINPRRLPEER
jgi:hypothetical protein